MFDLFMNEQMRFVDNELQIDSLLKEHKCGKN